MPYYQQDQDEEKSLLSGHSGSKSDETMHQKHVVPTIMITLGIILMLGVFISSNRFSTSNEIASNTELALETHENSRTQSLGTEKPGFVWDFGGVIGDNWKLVRHVPAGNSWHPATDQLGGWQTYGSHDASTGLTDPRAFSYRFDSLNFDEFLFATGDMKKWAIMKKSDVYGFYANEPRKIIASSSNPNTYYARMYRRQGTSEDPWISLEDHHPAIGNGNILYGGANFGSTHAATVLPRFNGANVFIRQSAPLLTGIEKPGFVWNFPNPIGEGWKLVRHVPAGNNWHLARDQLSGTQEYGTHDPTTGLTDYNSFSFRFDNIDFDEFLFATGDMTKWLIMKKSDVYGFYANEPRKIIASSQNPNLSYARMYRRQGAPEDPWISLEDHSPAIGNGNILYGENSFGGSHATRVLPVNNGANVFIRKLSPPTSAPISSPSQSPISNPTQYPIANPTAYPIANPTAYPIANPSAYPIANPTAYPISNPTAYPIANPTAYPISNPTSYPIANPTAYPISNPTAYPIANPTAYPIADPTAYPIADPTANPIANPTASPVADFTDSPIADTTQYPIADATDAPVSPVVPPGAVFCPSVYEENGSAPSLDENCALFAVNNLLWAQSKGTSVIFTVCASATDGPINISSEKLASLGIIADGKSKLSLITYGSKSEVKIFSGPDSSGESYVFSAKTRKTFQPLTSFKFKNSNGNDGVYSAIFSTTSTAAAKSCA